MLLHGPIYRIVDVCYFPKTPLWSTIHANWLFCRYELKSFQQRTMWNSNINSPLIPWSVNLFLRYKSSIFCNVHLKWYISHSFKGWRRFMLWALTKIRSILRPYNLSFLLTTTSFIPSWIMMNEMGVSSHKGKYSGHLKLCRLQITWQWAVVIFGMRRVRFKININAIIILLEVMYWI